MESTTSREIIILRRLHQNLNGNDADLLGGVINGVLSNEDIQRVCELINDEYLIKGIEIDYSPNEYGRELEKLLNKINSSRLS